MKRETPLPWVEALESAGLHSARDLARELAVSPQTAVRLIHGEQTSRETMEAAAGILGLTVEKVQELRGETPLPPFRLPPEADRLSQRQRAAVFAVVRAMLEPEDGTATKRAAPAARVPLNNDEKKADATINRLRAQGDEGS